MSVGVLGRRYGQALLSLAEEAGGGAVGKVNRDLHEFANTWEESRELRAIFENPSFSHDARRQILRSVADQSGMHELLRNTLLLLSDRGRMGFLRELVDSFDAMAAARSGQLRAEVVSATDLPDSYYTELQLALRTVTGKEVTVTHRTDKSLLGGVVTTIGDQVFDGSLRNRLSELKDELLR